MTIEINEKVTAEELNALIEKVEPVAKLFDAKKYFNKVFIAEDPLKLQQDLRDE